MKKDKNNAIGKYLAGIGSKGGKARAKNHDAATLSKWAKLGGRPKKNKQASGRAKKEQK
jgi:hypothetical protein